MRRLVPLFVSAWLCTACDSVWDLEHLDEPTPGIVDAPFGHDEDHDGLDDAHDPCPFDTRNTGDADGDGIADACDPDPDKLDEVVMFSGFDPASRTHFTPTDGSFDADSFRATGTGTAALIWDGDPDGTFLLVGIDVESVEATSYREVGLIFDATVNTTTQPNGTYCVLGRDFNENDYLEVYGRARPLADEPINHTDVQLMLPAFSGLLRAAYQRGIPPAVSCTFSDANLTVTTTGTPMIAPAKGTLALFAQDVTASFRFLFVVRRR